MMEEELRYHIELLGRDEDKNFAECAGDALRKILANYSKDDSAIIGKLVMDFGLEGAMKMLESAMSLADVVDSVYTN